VTGELAKALAAFHADLPAVSKGSENAHFRSKYADLADIVKVVLPALAKQGLAWIAAPRITEDGFVLHYELRHVSGETVEGQWPLPDPTAATPQQLGAATTYAKRFTLSAVTGIAPDEDDDGNSISADNAPRAASRKPRDSQQRAAAAIAAIGNAATLAELEKVQERIPADLLGIEALVKALGERKQALAGTMPPPVVDHWAATPVPS
jgi:hypothetical protein